LSYRGVKC